MKCPRCNSAVENPADDQGLMTCLTCGARLRRGPSRSDVDSLLARADTHTPTAPFNPNATLPPGTPRPRIPRPGEPGAPDGPPLPAELPPLPIAPVSLEAVIHELKGIRAVQEQILGLLKDRPPAAAEAPAAEPEEEAAVATAVPAVAPVRSRRRKTVLLIDDDPISRSAAVAALEHAQVPVRTAADGQSGLAALAAERSDVVVIELAMRGSMGGKDVINMIKATMEWVDIPLVLYTRQAVVSQKEARIEHGADEFVLKGAGGPESLVAKVILQFRKS
jgi:CheY-like chemotaxis protein